MAIEHDGVDVEEAAGVSPTRVVHPARPVEGNVRATTIQGMCGGEQLASLADAARPCSHPNSVVVLVLAAVQNEVVEEAEVCSRRVVLGGKSCDGAAHGGEEALGGNKSMGHGRATAHPGCVGLVPES